MTPFEIISAGVNSQRVAREIISALAEAGFEIVETQDRMVRVSHYVTVTTDFGDGLNVNRDGLNVERMKLSMILPRYP